MHDASRNMLIAIGFLVAGVIVLTCLSRISVTTSILIIIASISIQYFCLWTYMKWSISKYYEYTSDVVWAELITAQCLSLPNSKD
jgi:hypothetical protein